MNDPIQPQRPRRNPHKERSNVRRANEATPVEPASDLATPLHPKRLRRDPRAERQARLQREPAPAPVADEQSVSGRVRRDPRLVHGARKKGADQAVPVLVTTQPQQHPVTPETTIARVRRDPRDRATPRPPAEVARASLAHQSIPVVRLEAPLCMVVAVLDLEAGAPSPADRDLLGAARTMADMLSGATVLISTSPSPELLRFDPAEFGADRVVSFFHPDFAAGLAESRVEAVLAAIASLNPRHVLFSDTALGGELGRRIAARLGERPATNVIRLSAGCQVTLLRDRGRSEASGPAPKVLILAPQSFDPVAPTPRREALSLPTPSFAVSGAVRDAGPVAVEPSTLPLGEAELILAAGNGVRDWTSFHDIAKALGAAEGGSRVVCDDGHLPRDRQIGASGTLVAPRCYLALGISGASQHLAGIVEAQRVVAVNSDPHSEMIKRADLAIIADVQAVMPALLRQARGVP